MNDHDQRYIESRSVLPYLAYVRRLIDPAGRRLLDVGCGHGWLAEAAAREGALYTGVDVDAETVAGARRLHPTARFIEARAEVLPFAGGSFDIIVGVDVVEHIPDLRRAFSEFFRVLAPGGVVVLFGPNFFWPGNEDSCFREKWRFLLRAVSGRRAGASLQRPGVAGLLLVRALRHTGFRDAFCVAPLRCGCVPVQRHVAAILDVFRPTVRVGALR